MIVVACVDDKGGMLFNRRRQSQDRLLRRNLLEEAGTRTVWMNAYSGKLFAPAPENVRIAENFASLAGKNELCFFEDADPLPWLNGAEGIVLYHWNRVYPADRFLPLPLEGWSAARSEEFPGSSHERITKEVLIRLNR